MEDLLHLYGLPVDDNRPVVCFDELPVQLLGEVVAPLPVKAGRAERFDYEYEREGTACLLVAFEPLTGRRLVEASKQRTKADYCRFLQRVAALFPSAEKVVLVQDNFNTHTCRRRKPSLWRKRSRCTTRRRRGHGSTWRSWSCQPSRASASRGASPPSRISTARCNRLSKSGTG